MQLMAQKKKNNLERIVVFYSASCYASLLDLTVFFPYYAFEIIFLKLILIYIIHQNLFHWLWRYESFMYTFLFFFFFLKMLLKPDFWKKKKKHKRQDEEKDFRFFLLSERVNCDRARIWTESHFLALFTRDTFICSETVPQLAFL